MRHADTIDDIRGGYLSLYNKPSFVSCVVYE